MILIKDLNKSFLIPHERHFSLRSRVLAAFKKSSATELHVLKDINIEIPEGECVGIIGHNGCGKSTLLKLIAGILEPDSGEIMVKGTISPFLELGVGFNLELTVFDNIYLYASVLGLNGDEIDEKFDSIIEFSGLHDFVDAKLKTLSSGMQVRAAFSVASAVDRSIYLADEVLAVGDIHFQEKCLNVFRSLQDQGKTIVFVSHSLESISEFCTRVIWLNDGVVAAMGNTDDVISQYCHFMKVPVNSAGVKNGGKKKIAQKSAESNIAQTVEGRICSFLPQACENLLLSGSASEIDNAWFDSRCSLTKADFSEKQEWQAVLDGDDTSFDAVIASMVPSADFSRFFSDIVTLLSDDGRLIICGGFGAELPLFISSAEDCSLKMEEKEDISDLIAPSSEILLEHLHRYISDGSESKDLTDDEAGRFANLLTRYKTQCKSDDIGFYILVFQK